MRSEIIDILKQYGADLSEFYIANGVKSSSSEIHLSGKKKAKNKKYAIQFDPATRVVVIWDIQKRVELDVSLDLYWYPSNIKWNQIRPCCETYVDIKHRDRKITGFRSKIVAVSIDALETYLLFNDLGIKQNNIDSLESKRELSSVNMSEGGRIQFYGTKYERNPKLRQRAVEIHGYTCAVCKFNFEEKYGNRGRNYIEVHHIKPLSECNGEHTVDPAIDMVCLCSNCHRMIHRVNTCSVAELCEVINQAKHETDD